MKKIIKLTIIACAALCVMTAAGCGRNAAEQSDAMPPKTYAFIPKDLQNSYMLKMYTGFQKACSETGAKAVYCPPSSATADEQAEVINSLVQQKVAGIAVAANNEYDLRQSLRAAMDEGIEVVSLDSAVVDDARQLHIQQADPALIGKSLIQSAYDLTGGSGGIAILSTTEDATNQNDWINCMKKELESDPAKYANMPLVKIAYGNDDATKSRTETQSLIEMPDVKVIIAPTAVGLLAGCELISETGADTKIIGLGLPSEIAPYIRSGVCPAAYLWNPGDVGYLAGYALRALEGSITGASGQSFECGELGSRTITDSATGGTEAVLGTIVKFDSSNIDEWENSF